MARDRMETVLRLRQLRERELRADLGAATHRVTQAEEVLAAARRARDEHVTSAHDVATLQLQRAVAVGLQQEVEVALDELRAARAARIEALEAWQEARAEEKAVERLLERRRQERRAEQRTAELREMDELALLGGGGHR